MTVLRDRVAAWRKVRAIDANGITLDCSAADLPTRPKGEPGDEASSGNGPQELSYRPREEAPCPAR